MKDTNIDYDKIIEVELQKKKLKSDYNMQSYSSNDLPVDIEKSWLDYIENFEERHKNAEKVEIYTLIGEPEICDIATFSEHDLKQELDDLRALLCKNHILIETLCDVEDKELYRFIVEDLFKQEIDNVHIQGMMTCFTYEEFYPNDRYDIEHASRHFLDIFSMKRKGRKLVEFDLLYLDQETFISSSGHRVEQELLLSKINAFYESYDTFNVIEYEIIRNDIIHEDKAIFEFKINYDALFDNNRQKMNYCGEGRFKLKPSCFGGWEIYSIAMPGLLI